jgi:hypothetical protein
MIRPAYWTDADLHVRLTAEQREFYIGLWMEADDAGFIAWDVDRIGADLSPYRTLGWRRSRLPAWLALLEPHVQMLGCGAHVLVPTLSRHQAPPKPSYQNKRAHDACLHHLAPRGTSGDGRNPPSHMAPDGTSGRQMVPAREGGLVGEEGKGFRKGAAADFEDTGEGITEFQRKIAAAKA